MVVLLQLQLLFSAGTLVNTKVACVCVSWHIWKQGKQLSDRSLCSTVGAACKVPSTVHSYAKEESYANNG